MLLNLSATSAKITSRHADAAVILHAFHNWCDVVAACRMGDLLYKLTSMKFQEPDEGEEKVKQHMETVRSELTDRFRSLEEEFR